MQKNLETIEFSLSVIIFNDIFVTNFIIIISIILFMYQHWITCHSQATWFRYPTYRYWRKNLATLNGTQCLGVDLNRNFDANWNQVNS